MEEFLNSWIFKTIIALIITYIILTINKKVFKKYNTGRKIHLIFFENLIKFVVVLFCIMKIGNQNQEFHEFSTTILTSSSLLVVVIGFAFQEGLSNIIHGIIISICHPFNIGDRVSLTVDGKNITGYIENITLHHTVVNNLITSSSVIVPNSKMDNLSFENFHYEYHTEEVRVHKNPIDVSISYESDRKLAKKLIHDIVSNDQYVKKVLDCPDIEPDKYNVQVLVRELQDSGIALRVFVYTLSIEDNFLACSNIREEILDKFEENNIEIPYPHTTLTGTISVKQEDTSIPDIER